VRVWLLAALVACSNKSEKPATGEGSSAADEPQPESARARSRAVPANVAFEHVGARAELPEDYTAWIEPGTPPVVRLEGPGAFIQVSRLSPDDVPTSVDDPRWLAEGMKVVRSERLDSGWLAEVSANEEDPPEVWAQIGAGPGQVLLCISVASEDAGHTAIARRFCRALRPR
jgi:hypothetical protein